MERRKKVAGDPGSRLCRAAGGSDKDKDVSGGGEDRSEMDELWASPTGKAMVQMGGGSKEGKSAELAGKAQRSAEAKGEAFSKGRWWSTSPHSRENLWRKKTRRTPGFGAQDCYGVPEDQRSAFTRVTCQEGCSKCLPHNEPRSLRLTRCQDRARTSLRTKDRGTSRGGGATGKKRESHQDEGILLVLTVEGRTSTQGW